jgi:hypothetical protein
VLTVQETKHCRVVLPSRFDSLGSVNICALPRWPRLIEKSLCQAVMLTSILCLDRPEVFDPRV